MNAMRVTRGFIFLSGAVLLTTASVKLIGSMGNAPMLNHIDPILPLSFRQVFWLVGGLEMAVALFCFFSNKTAQQTLALASLATSFVVYRLGLVWIGYQKPCSCAGNITDVLHIPPEMAEAAMKIILGYLLIGSYSALFWIWMRAQRTDAGPMTLAR